MSDGSLLAKWASGVERTPQPTDGVGDPAAGIIGLWRGRHAGHGGYVVFETQRDPIVLYEARRLTCSHCSKRLMFAVDVDGAQYVDELEFEDENDAEKVTRRTRIWSRTPGWQAGGSWSSELTYKITSQPKPKPEKGRAKVVFDEDV